MDKFSRIVQITLISCYVLIFVGSLVRTTGSGLGCPDWPYCFGRFIPPISVHDLPENYQEVFAISGKKIATFDPFKTWTEYLNRLLGVVVGIEMFLLLFLSWRRKNFFSLCLGAFVLTGIQGWIGAKVVSTGLNPHIISLHMIMAVVILFILHILYEKTQRMKAPVLSLKFLLPVFLLSLTQLMLGTLLRQRVDGLVHTGQGNFLTIPSESLGNIFLVHRLNALILLLGNLFLFFKMPRPKRLLPMCFLLITLASGISLSYFTVPSILASVHLVGSCLYLGILFSLVLKAWYASFELHGSENS